MDPVLSKILTFVQRIGEGRVIQQTDRGQVRVNDSQILEVTSIAEEASLSKVSLVKERLVLIQPIDHWIGILRHGSCKDDKFVPFSNLMFEHAKY